jgi:hypothetical protein
MTVAGILWVVVTPYCTGLVVASSGRANRLVTRHLTASIVVGWTALGTLFAGVFAVGGRTGMLMALSSAPFVGLAVWKAGPHRGDGGGSPPAPDDKPPAPDAVGHKGRRLPSPARKRPTGHREPRRAPRRIPSR